MYERILIAGTGSGCGKTTITCALLGALKARGISVASYKCGPDYIDPMFHRTALGLDAHNLDPFFSDAAQLASRLYESRAQLSVIEGVMGYFDGIGAGTHASTYDVARLTGTPVILALNAGGMCASAGAIIEGFSRFRPDGNIRGVIFNNASPARYEGLSGIARDAGVTPLGFLPYERELAIPERKLGLVSAGELPDIQKKLAVLSALAQAHIDIDGILAFAATAGALNPAAAPYTHVGSVRIAVARDDAFCFIYKENLELLEALGAKLCFFSPLCDTLPEGIGGLYLPGGYPELHTEALSSNRALRAQICAAIRGGLPTIAECGGFLYLHETLDTLPMAGVIHGTAYRTPKLQRFGYVTLTAERDNLLCRAGESIRAHEFHYYESTAPGTDFSAQKASGARYMCAYATPALYAGFAHLYFPANPAFAQSFIRKATEYETANPA